MIEIKFTATVNGQSVSEVVSFKNSLPSEQPLAFEKLIKVMMHEIGIKTSRMVIREMYKGDSDAK